MITIPYSELDSNIVSLVKTLNQYPGVSTIGSCGGHKKPENPSQWADGSWYVKFVIEANKTGWRVVEFLAWAVNNDLRRSDLFVEFVPVAPPPFLNDPGDCLAWVIEGYRHTNPDDVAAFLERMLPKLDLPKGLNT